MALKKLKDEANENEIKLIEMVASIYEQFKNTKDNAVEKVKDAVSTVDTSVHLYPWRYVGGAAALSFLAGLLCHRRKH